MENKIELEINKVREPKYCYSAKEALQAIEDGYVAYCIMENNKAEVLLLNLD